MTFGEKVQRLRKKENISQEELAFQLHVSRQAISKWESNKGYPETEKIIKMSEIFHVTLDYLLNDSQDINEHAMNDEKGFYVNREMAYGYLFHETLKYKKMAWAIALLLGGMAPMLLFPKVGSFLYLVMIITSISLFVAIFLFGNPYKQLKKESLLFEERVQEELEGIYIGKRKKYNILILFSIILFFSSFLILPLLLKIESFKNMDEIILALILFLWGVSVYLFVYLLGILQAYRFLGTKNSMKKE